MVLWPAHRARRATRCWLSIAAVAALACSTPEERLDRHLANGARLLGEGNKEDAELEFRSALSIDPQSADAHEKLGNALARMGKEEGAQHLLDAFSLDPDRVDTAMKAARILMRSDRAAASNVIRTALSQHPEAAVVHATNSEFALIRNDSRGALASAKRAVDLGADRWSNWFQLGKAYQAMMRERRLRRQSPVDSYFQGALDAFSKADELADGLVRARIEKARVLGSRPGRAALAQAQFESAFDLALEKGTAADRQRVAEHALEFARGRADFDFLEWALRRVIDAQPDHLGAWNRLAVLEDTRGGDGQRVLTELIEQRPWDVSSHILFTNYLINMKRAGDALDHLRGLLDRDLDEPRIWEQIVRIQIQRRKLANARASYVEMVDHHPDDPVTRRVDARIAIAEGRYEQASETLRGLLSVDESPNIAYLLAQSELSLGNLANAAAAIERAVPDTSEAPPSVLRLRARIHHEASEWDLALRAFNELSNRGIPLIGDEKLLVARSLYETGQADRGRELLLELLEQDRPAPEVAVEYARREAKRDRAGARRYLGEALQRSPVEHGVLKILTQMDIVEERFGPALARLDRAIDTERAGAQVLLLRGYLNHQTRRFARAEKDVLRAFEADPTLNGAAELLFQIYREQGRLREAQDSFAQADAAGVLHAGARHLLGRIYIHHGEFEQARIILDKLVESDPDLIQAQSDLSFLLAEMGVDLDRALEMAETVQQVLSQDAKAADRVGYVYLRKGLNEAALQQFRYAIELSRSNRFKTRVPVYQYHLGLALRALDRNREASMAFERALALDPNFGEADDAREQLEAMRNLTADAISPS